MATASRVLSGSKHPVSEATRERVLIAAKNLHFEPNRLARALVTSKSQIVGVIVHDISDPYFGEIVRGLEDGIHARDYRLFVASSDREPENELSYVRAFLAHQVDAIVFAASAIADRSYAKTLEDLMSRFRSRGGVIVVLSEHILDGLRVGVDNRRAVEQMVSYLASRGHRRIAYIGGPRGLRVSEVRLQGFVDSVSKFGLESDGNYVAEGDFTVTGGETAMSELLDSVQPTAVFAASDLMAIGATRRLLEMGIAVPEKISVAGFDGIPFAAYGPVPLTTLRVPLYEMGRQGAALLLDALDSNTVDDLLLDCEIVERASVATVR